MCWNFIQSPSRQEAFPSHDHWHSPQPRINENNAVVAAFLRAVGWLVGWFSHLQLILFQLTSLGITHKNYSKSHRKSFRWDKSFRERSVVKSFSFFLFHRARLKKFPENLQSRVEGGVKNFGWAADCSHLIDGQITFQLPSPLCFRSLEDHFGDGCRSCRVTTTQRWQATILEEKKIERRSQKKKKAAWWNPAAGSRKRDTGCVPSQNTTWKWKKHKHNEWFANGIGRGGGGESVQGPSSAEGLFCKQADTLKQYSWVSSLLSGW